MSLLCRSESSLGKWGPALVKPRLWKGLESRPSVCKVSREMSTLLLYQHGLTASETRDTDGPAGVRPADGHTQFPAGVTTAATWDRELIYNRSRTMGQEFYDLGKCDVGLRAPLPA